MLKNAGAKKKSVAEGVLNWVQCDGCERWELFENTGIAGPYDKETINEAKFRCRNCCFENKLETMEVDLKKLRVENEQLKDLLSNMEIM